MAVMDVSRQRRSLLHDATVLEHLPAELLDVIKDHTATKLLDAVAEASLLPPLTERIFVHFEDAFPDICARWILNSGDLRRKIRIFSALARVLPFAPHLSAFLDTPTTDLSSLSQPPSLRLSFPHQDEVSQRLDDSALLEYLTAAWRLVNFGERRFGNVVSPAFVQAHFAHGNNAVRYVAIRIFCRILHTSDYKLEVLLQKHLEGEEAITGELDGALVDYGFLTLYEHERVQRVIALRHSNNKHAEHEAEKSYPQKLTPYVVSYGQALLPRPLGPVGEPSSLVLTPTTANNLEQLACMLQNSNPILLHGLPGSGKTSLVHEAANQLGMYPSMVTLHLNEQTDAKMLIGLYSTDSKPGSFQWRPGVLTTAVKEGRWVLVEDLDRAPTEVLSTLLPLIERRELLIPSRGERIHAASTFRLFATLRTSRGMHGRENLPSVVGMRFWQSLHIEPMAQDELLDVVIQKHPVLRDIAPMIMSVYVRLSHVGQNGAMSAGTRFMGSRQMSSADLLKWCRRLQELLVAAHSVSGDGTISDTTTDWMFMEALDCFVGCCPDADGASKLGFAIAEEMHVSKERAEHYMTAYIPPLVEDDAQFNIGRVRLRKQKLSNRLQKSKRPFASTAHAKRLLEQIAVAVKLSEPVLLVGETGIGKTTVVQQLAESLGHKLIAVNLSQQSEVGDLLGGFKPVNVRTLAVPLKEEFEDLFAATGISASKNQKYLEQVGKCFARAQWSRVSKLWREAPKMFVKIVQDLEQRALSSEAEARNGDTQPAKRRKTHSKLQSLLDLRPRWDAFAQRLEQFEVQISGGENSFAFSFMEGNLVKAVRNGDWVLLDEINLASPDTLESIADLITGVSERPSILLSETGEIEKIEAHPNFRIFGAMNPATDIGKRDLPTGIRTRFTELYVRSPDTDTKDLLTIIKTYLGSSSYKHDQAADDIASLYLNTKRLAADRRIVDGANEVPHFSLRTLTRVLSFVNSIAPLYGLRRALYEGFSMGFLTLLNRDSEKMLLPLIYHHLFGRHDNPHSLLSQPPKQPNDGKQHIRFKNKSKDRQYWLFQGNEPPVERDDYIITPYVERNLLNLVRATSTRRFPVLIQGPTSAGKTSMIEYLANYTGNKFVRINNHEHTDLQEYLGTYVSGSDGKLRFQEGLLVQAMRQGHWIVLDELNLAPTDVLEALNRLLDDNRELLIPETQEVVKPHENFILFATQNPPGLYGGRKVLSRAFRNRFLELHFDDIPEDELEYILQQRSKKTSPPDCRRIVTVYKELSRLRQTGRLFEQKDSFATLRDLFRWALRNAETREEIAIHGFMLLAERVRNQAERLAVKEVIEKVFKVKIDPEELYSSQTAPELKSFSSKVNSQGVVWSHAMRRLYVLVARALRNNEPVLLVGETGCGKTTVCQLLAEAQGNHLHIVNAHQNTETGDLIGSQRPIRNRAAILESLDRDLTAALIQVGLDTAGSVEERLQIYRGISESTASTIDGAIRQRISLNETRSKALFEWSDGALVEAMRCGHFFLLDEISLADDSVLERMNSVLEPQRTLLLAEKGVDNSFVTASLGFQMLATMNPGGDFGKKELSPALRNRFTEIWVPPLSGTDDIYEIVGAKLDDSCKEMVNVIVGFASWFGETFRSMSSTKFSIREILVWVQFINRFHTKGLVAALVHGASTIFIDSIGANPSAILAADAQSISQQRKQCLVKLSELLSQDVLAIYQTEPKLLMSDEYLSIGDFSVPRTLTASADPGFAFHAPATRLNAMRVLRALQMEKPILLEGSPGVGKTTLVAALSRACGQPLTRINLSDQTDLMDLFGTDVPVEGAEAGHFAWRDAPFLQAMQKGEWVLLDEMNLASQSVLEGLNACLDHRGEVYISELDQVFKRHPNFRLFAAQNPHHQGGGRKGLPSSFVNRFVVVYADIFTNEDLQLIASHNFPNLPSEIITSIIRFISQMEHAITSERSFGSQGGPWEFNLRDVLRWLHLLDASDDLLHTAKMEDFLSIIVKQRFRTQRDRDEVEKLFKNTTGLFPRTRNFYHSLHPLFGQVGLALLSRDLVVQPEQLPSIDIVSRLPELETLMICVKQNIPCILSAPSGYGKSVLIEHVAALAGKRLVIFPMNADIDSMDLIGGFEQADPLREVNSILMRLRDSLQRSIASLVPAEAPGQALALLELLHGYTGTLEAIKAIDMSIDSLLQATSFKSEIGVLLMSALQLLRGPLTLSNPRFEWMDGVIVKALQTGQWLVLDNANMCNASVLDRLNSLLEPNGFLSINEHCGPGGEPRIVLPHPEFRIFLTMDPRYGELSRAMRNRAIEVHIHTPPPEVNPFMVKIAPVESKLQRLLSINNLKDEGALVSVEDVMDIQLDHLLIQDIPLLPRFTAQFCSMSCKVGRCLPDFIEFLRSPSGSNAIASISASYELLSNSQLSKAQPIHILNNHPIFKLLPEQYHANWTAICYEFSHYIYRLRQSLKNYAQHAQGSKLGTLSRLQRSLVSDRVAAVSKDSTVHLAPFLNQFSTLMSDYVNAGPSALDSWMDYVVMLRLLLHYLYQTISLTNERDFDDARFQAHLAMGADMLQKLIQAHSGHKELSLLRNTAELVNKSFIAGFKLSTGLSMEPLWLCFRPTPFCDEAMLNNSMELEKLANRFDSLRWRASASLNDLRQASMTLERAYELVKGAQLTSSGLVDDLKSVISGLEKRIPIESTEVTPYFAEEFERLRQVHFLRHRGRQSMADEAGRDLLMLSNIPTIISMAFASPNQAALALQSVDALACHGPFVWDGKFAASLWSKLQHIHSVPLSALALLETEFPIMGKHVSSLAAEISMDSLIELNKVLLDLIFEVFNALDPKLRPVAIRVSEAASRQLAADHTQPTSHALRIPEFHDLFDSIETSHVKEITASHLAPAIVAIAAASYNLACCSHFSALAWSHFSLGAIKLYVPDRVFDPQIRPRLEREFTKRLQDGLGQRISALEVFEAKFSGQTTNIRVEQLQQELARIDLPPEATKPIFRPEKSELGRVHAEFTNILRTVASVDLLAGAESLDSELAIANDRAQFVRENIQLLVNRLSGRFEAYQDMTRPVISVLRCCLIGLSLCDASTSKALSSPALDLVKVTPFAGGYCGSQESLIAVRSFEFLNYATAVIAIEGISKIQNPIRQSIFECFHQFYDEWTNRLEADKKAEAENTSLYRFRGSAEDEEQVDAEEFNELFPSYNDDGSDVSPVRPRDQVREKSIKVARAHQKLFLVPETPLKALSNLCISTGRYVASDLKNHAYIDRDSNGILLPATVLFLHQKKELMDSSTNEQYNFYTSENFSQVRLLVLLTNKLKSRFRDLQMIDEIGHMQPLADVIQSCDKVLSLVHTEPLAKILPNVEHLHAQVYEWQFGGWASRVHSVLELHNELTDTIIRWRRLELSTWSNLFEMERRKCEEDAYSWWFVAYQVVIAVPLSMVDSPSELGGYAVSLTQNLELYFSASIVGQFSARLALLNQLKLHLQLLTNDYPNLEVIYQAVNNFISFYTRYEKPANEWIMKGRAPIDKSMKDVLLMASWKDTNINALRESARKSHMKLFRIIRKFRNVLGHEMKLVIQQGLPDETVETYSANPQDSVRSSKFPIINLAQLADLSSRWLEKNRRLVNSNKTVNKMRGIVQSPALAAEVASVLENHVTSLDICIAELRKETPPFLTDENKELVKHLKTRKRKVFADTLRDLRLMGIRFNLAQNELSKQDSLPVIMASTPPVDLPQSPTLTAANYHFHKVLDLAPKARNALQEHSDELTAAEVARSVGFVEGMIHLLVSQRQGLASGAKSLASLQAAIQQVENLGDVEKNLRLLHSEKKQTWSRVLPWLVRVLEMGVHLVNIHGSLGGENTDLVVQALQRWVDRFHEHLSKLQNLSECPEKITTEAHLEAETAFSLDVQMMDEELQQISESKPEMGYIVKHISLWSQVDSCALDKHVSQSSLVEFGDVISRLCDKILVAVETIERLGNEVTANEDEPGWFMKRAGLSASIIKKLHIDTITSDINNAIEEIQNIDLTKAEKSTTVMAILGLASPILDQYHVLCRQSTSRLLEIHGATSKLAFYLTKTFTQMASQGFCTPQEKSDEKSGDAGNVESGTGLGDGEGAEDISKDIKEDEDLTELAQEANKEKNGEIEDEKDAVDMADEEMEGEMGSVTGEDEEETDSKDGDDEKEEDDMDEEAGDVDDLDPTAVDEKMWDGKDEEKADKDQLGDKAKGQKNDDEQMAADENSKKDEVKDNQGQDQDKDDEQQDPDIPEDEPEEAKAQEELNKQEQTAEEKDTLAMPEDMELDLGDDDAMSSDSDDLDLPSDAAEEHNEVDDAENNGSDDGDIETEKPKEAENGAEDDTEEDPEDEVKVKGDDEVQDEVDPEKDAEEDTNMEDELEQQHPHQKDDSAITDNENAAQSDVKSSGIDENGESMELDDDFRDSTAQREQGEMGQSAADQETSAGNKGSDLKRETAADEQDQNQEQDRDDKESARADPFKKLGDALERWHRQQSDIKETDANDQQSDQKQLPEADQGRKEFQHLQDDDAAPDDQALGTADDDQVQPIDESMAIDEEKKDPSSRLMDEEKDEPANDKMDNLDDDDVAEADEKNTREPDTSRSGVKTRQGNFEDEQTSSDEEKQTQEREEDETIEETSTQLSTTHISAAERELRDFGQCMQQWVEFQSKTNPLALSLTSQLRLILTPSQSTKLSGSFRTGKRLSIKRIIPYIASSYKRDKIWMRRSIPTKRTYQILLCVDDSRSMGESSSGSLALESLVMVSRSLTMLEAGQVGVVGFGSDVFTAHALTEPFAADAGAKVLQRFSFSQDRTDVALLIRQTIDTFRTARQQSGGNSDLWQLSLILSDGLTPSSAHDSIRRLLREAIEERIMIVFIIMDDTEQKKGDSVLELKEARFVNEGGESRVLIERYLDTFPFQYYLIVHNLEELPNALAGLLRTWFAEVAP